MDGELAYPRFKVDLLCMATCQEQTAVETMMKERDTDLSECKRAPLKEMPGAGETAQQARALAAFPEDPDSFSSTHVVAHNQLWLHLQEEQTPLFRSLRAPAMHVVHAKHQYTK